MQTSLKSRKAFLKAAVAEWVEAHPASEQEEGDSEEQEEQQEEPQGQKAETGTASAAEAEAAEQEDKGEQEQTAGEKGEPQQEQGQQEAAAKPDAGGAAEGAAAEAEQQPAEEAAGGEAAAADAGAQQVGGKWWPGVGLLHTHTHQHGHAEWVIMIMGCVRACLHHGMCSRRGNNRSAIACKQQPCLCLRWASWCQCAIALFITYVHAALLCRTISKRLSSQLEQLTRSLVQLLLQQQRLLQTLRPRMQLEQWLEHHQGLSHHTRQELITKLGRVRQLLLVLDCHSRGVFELPAWPSVMTNFGMTARQLVGLPCWGIQLPADMVIALM